MPNLQVPDSQALATQIPLVERLNLEKVLRLEPVGAIATGASKYYALAAALTDHALQSITGADKTKGVILPSAPIGTVIILDNATNDDLVVYPRIGEAFNHGTACAGGNASTGSLDIAEYSTMIAVKTGPANWQAIYTAA